MERRNYFGTNRFWTLMAAIGLGALMAFVFDEFIIPENQNPALYPGIIFTLAGFSQLIPRKNHD